MCPKLDTRYPYPKPDTSSVQMGTSRPTCTRLPTPIQNSCHPPMTKSGRVDNPGCNSQQQRSTARPKRHNFARICRLASSYYQASCSTALSTAQLLNCSTLLQLPIGTEVQEYLSSSSCNLILAYQPHQNTSQRNARR